MSIDSSPLSSSHSAKVHFIWLRITLSRRKSLTILRWSLFLRQPEHEAHHIPHSQPEYVKAQPGAYPDAAANQAPTCQSDPYASFPEFEVCADSSLYQPIPVPLSSQVSVSEPPRLGSLHKVFRRHDSLKKTQSLQQFTCFNLFSQLQRITRARTNTGPRGRGPLPVPEFPRWNMTGNRAASRRDQNYVTVGVPVPRGPMGRLLGTVSRGASHL